ncbi:MAG: aconitate hydratase [Acidobacteria bacterium]|nr:aconitate hydratase [Acidobacteriota bacterium]
MSKKCAAGSRAAIPAVERCRPGAKQGVIVKHNLFNSLQTFPVSGGRRGEFYSLPQLEKEGIGPVSRLPLSIRVVLESVLRNFDGEKITEEDVVRLANWSPAAERTREIPFLVARILLQDFTGVPLLVDLAAMRSCVDRLGRPASLIEPLVPVDLVIDHSVQVDVAGRPDAMETNMKMEFQRNRARYQFLKWGTQGFRGFNVIPPGTGICHQVNLEYLAGVVQERDGVYFPDTLVGTDSHTTMINGLGVLGWGVGGIEAEAGMLGQPVYFLTPDVVGMRISGKLGKGVTATDLVLRVTEILRKAKVVGKFVEFFGPGVADLTVPDRATISNMGPEYGATLGLFPVDAMTCTYLAQTGRTPGRVDAVRNYYTAQQMFGSLDESFVRYSSVIELDLGEVEPCVAGPKRPQDRIPLGRLQDDFRELFGKAAAEGGYGRKASELENIYPVIIGAQAWTQMSGGGSQSPEKAGGADTSPATENEMVNNRPSPTYIEPAGTDSPGRASNLRHGSVVIASITSCTNTSNPSVMLAAGLLAKKAVEAGIAPPAHVKTSLAPGSRVVSDYLEKTGLQRYLDTIGFHLVGYGCATCIGNSGPLDPNIEDSISENDLVLASVLSGNRNFEARVHQSVRANFLMSPPLVVAFALAGTVDIDLTSDPLGRNEEGRNVYLSDIWPSMEDIRELMESSFDADTYRTQYAGFADRNPLWNAIPFAAGDIYRWDENSTYIQEPPFFENFEPGPRRIEPIRGARPLLILGRSVTTDHISPAGSIKPDSPAGRYLQERGVAVADFNSYGARRGNHQVMIRGTFANVRIRNLMAPGTEGGVTVHHPSRERMSVYDAACRYRESGTPLIVLAGQEYGTGSSRDWAAKGTMLLGVRAVIAQSFERIHRSNLVGMGVLPCQFMEGTGVESLKLDGSETFDLVGLDDNLKPHLELSLAIHRAEGSSETVPLLLRLDTKVEVDYYRHGGILQYVLSKLIG